MDAGDKKGSTRNPMYFQMVLVTVGVSHILSNAWILLLVPRVVLVLQKLAILPEEACLEQKFRDSYSAYKTRVSRRR